MPICEYCGRELAENEVCDCRSGEASPPPAVREEKAVPKRKLLKAIIITLIILVVLGLLGVAGLYKIMNDYTYNSRLTSANSATSSLYKAVNSSLIEMRDNGCSVDGYYLICSDRDKNINLPEDFDEDEFYKSVDYFFPDNTKCEWFAVVENDTAVYAAQSLKWKHTILGTYPSSGHDYLYYYGTGSVMTKKRAKATLQMFYDDTAEKVRANAEDEDFLREIMPDTETAKE